MSSQVKSTQVQVKSIRHDSQGCVIGGIVHDGSLLRLSLFLIRQLEYTTHGLGIRGSTIHKAYTHGASDSPGEYAGPLYVRSKVESHPHQFPHSFSTSTPLRTKSSLFRSAGVRPDSELRRTHGADATVLCTHRHPFAAAPRSGRPRQRARVASRRTGWPGHATLASRAALARRLASWAALVDSQTVVLTTAAITVATAAAAVSAATSSVSAVFSTATTVASAVRLHRSMAAKGRARYAPIASTTTLAAAAAFTAASSSAATVAATSYAAAAAAAALSAASSTAATTSVAASAARAAAAASPAFAASSTAATTSFTTAAATAATAAKALASSLAAALAAAAHFHASGRQQCRPHAPGDTRRAVRGLIRWRARPPPGDGGAPDALEHPRLLRLGERRPLDLRLDARLDSVDVGDASGGSRWHGHGDLRALPRRATE